MRETAMTREGRGGRQDVGGGGHGARGEDGCAKKQGRGGTMEAKRRKTDERKGEQGQLSRGGTMDEEDKRRTTRTRRQENDGEDKVFQ